MERVTEGALLKDYIRSLAGAEDSDALSCAIIVLKLKKTTAASEVKIELYSVSTIRWEVNTSFPGPLLEQLLHARPLIHVA